VLSIVLAAAEPSKVPFYFAGGIFALWAVVLSTIGLNRPEFPYSAIGARVVMGISVVLTVAAMSVAIAVSK
jgi:hypothetical protein